MTLDEASRRFLICREKIKFYEENGLLECHTFVDGVPDYTEEELCRLSMIHSLMKTGLDIDETKRCLDLLKSETEQRQECVRILRKQRCRLLEDIHEKQQLLDRIDYIITEIKKQK